jgi:flagellar export protein FliJ
LKDVLPLLIETAKAVRERQSANVAQAQLALAQAQSTLRRLQQFRAEYLARSPAARQGRSDGQALAQYTQFFGRLDDAIGQQQRETGLRQSQLEAQQAQLVRCHQRLQAFETLAHRLACERETRESRRLQGEADEFAARAASRAAMEALR